jgi:hypothetical protein
MSVPEISIQSQYDTSQLFMRFMANLFTALLICSLSVVKYNEHHLEKQGIGSSEVL